MCYKGPRGAMGWSSGDHPITIELIQLWNELGILDRYIHSEDDRPEPLHLKKLHDTIEAVREHLKNK